MGEEAAQANAQTGGRRLRKLNSERAGIVRRIVHIWNKRHESAAPKGPVTQAKPPPPLPQIDASRQREKAESIEAEGRHKNACQKDHKGAP